MPHLRRREERRFARADPGFSNGARALAGRGYARRVEPDDRAYAVGLAEEVFGPAVRARRWPFLVDDDGAPLEADGFWPDHGVALAVVAEPVERWRFAAVVLGLRDVRLLLVPADALRTGDDGRVVRDDVEVRRALFRAGLPGSREEFAALTAGSPALWTTSAVDVEGAYRREDGSWVGVSEIDEDEEVDREVWDGSGGAEEPWLPGWTFDRSEDDPWGGRGGWDEDRQAAIAAWAARGEAAARGEDDDGDPDGDDEGDWDVDPDDEEQDDADDWPWDDDEGGPRDAGGPGQDGRYAGEAPVALGWRSRPLALAALGAVVLARRVLAEDRTGDLSPTALQVLAALAVPDDAGPLRDLSTARGLAARLALRETTVRGVVEDLVERGLAKTAGDPEEAVELTRDGRAALLAWLERIAPLFGGWAPQREGPDDAA